MLVSKIVSGLILAALCAAPALAKDWPVQVSPGGSLTFVPSTVGPVGPGDTVTFTADDTIAHNVVADDGSFTSGTVKTSFTLVAHPTGTVTFHCTVHGSAGQGSTPGTGMAGVIVFATSPVKLQSMDVQP